MSINHVIGINKKIPWNIPMDIERFKAITFGQAIIMGNNTFNSMNRKPISGSTNIILTSNVNYRPEELVFKVKGLKQVNNILSHRKEFYIVGGESAYTQAIKETNVIKIYLTVINQYFDGDTYFPKIDSTMFECVKSETHEQNGLSFSFNELIKIK
jgi:dihydrofolate reductase